MVSFDPWFEGEYSHLWSWPAYFPVSHEICPRPKRHSIQAWSWSQERMWSDFGSSDGSKSLQGARAANHDKQQFAASHDNHQAAASHNNLHAAASHNKQQGSAALSVRYHKLDSTAATAINVRSIHRPFLLPEWKPVRILRKQNCFYGRSSSSFQDPQGYLSGFIFCRKNDAKSSRSMQANAMINPGRA